MSNKGQKKEPKVSVIIPTYNLAGTLTARSIPSVLRQTYKNIECIVIDDGSTDDTEERVKKLAQHDSRLRYFKVSHAGQSAGKNFAVLHAQGDFIAFNDDDDEYLPLYIETAVKEFEKLPPDVGYMSCGVINIDERGFKTYYFPELKPAWKLSVGNGWIFRKEVFRVHKLFSNPDISGFEDIDLHLRLQPIYQGFVIPKPLRIYYVRLAERTGSRSPSAERKAESFDRFLAMYESPYRSFGSDALSWIYFFGGLMNGRAGKMKRSRKLLYNSFTTKPSILCLSYLAFSFFGYGLFMRYDIFKNRLMRVVRAKILNRAS